MNAAQITRAWDRRAALHRTVQHIIALGHPAYSVLCALRYEQVRDLVMYHDIGPMGPKRFAVDNLLPFYQR
jgi:hypothetical protein